MQKVYCRDCKHFNYHSSLEASIHVTLKKGEKNYIQNFVTEKVVCHVPIGIKFISYNWFAKGAKPEETVMEYKMGKCSVKNRNNDCKDYKEK